MKYEVGRYPNSMKNLKTNSWPREAQDDPCGKGRKKAIRDYMKEYLENGEAVKDFEKVRLKKPEIALNEAMDRIYGKVSQPLPKGNQGPNIAMLVHVLCGKTEQSHVAEGERSLAINANCEPYNLTDRIPIENRKTEEP